MDSLTLKTKNKIVNLNKSKDLEKSVSYPPQLVECLQDKRDFEITTNEIVKKTSQGKNRIQLNVQQNQNVKWGSLKKFLYKRRIMLNRQIHHPSSQQNVQTEQSAFTNSTSLKTSFSKKCLNMNQTNENNSSFYSKNDQDVGNQIAGNYSFKKQTNSFLSASSLTQIPHTSSIVSISSTAQLQAANTNTNTDTVNNQSNSSNNTSKLLNHLSNNKKNTNSISNFSSSSMNSILNSKEKKLISVKTQKQLNFLILRRINKSQLNTTMSDDQQSYEEEYYRKASSSFRNICENESMILEQKRIKTSETNYSSFESSYKSNGYTNFLFSPSLNTSEIQEECCIPERCQNPLSKDIQFLNLASQESNFQELKKKILFDEDLFDFII